MITSQFVDLGRCKQVDIVKAFGVTAISVKRSVKQYRKRGVASFFKERNTRGQSVWTQEKKENAQILLNQGRTREEVSKVLGIKSDTLYRKIHSGELVEPKKKLD